MPDPNPSERLAEIEARVEAATEGPWEVMGGEHPHVKGLGDAAGREFLTVVGRSEEHPGIAPIVHYAELHEPGSQEYRLRDAVFIAHAREDIPWLLEREKKLREVLAAYRSALRSGEPESEQLRQFGDAALADSGGASGEAAESSP